MGVKVERVVDSVELGEGPHWDVATKSLYFVDIFGKSIHKFTPNSKKYAIAKLGDVEKDANVSFILPVKGAGNKFVISLGRKIVEINWDGNSDKVEIIKTLGEVDQDNDTLCNRLNDGKCDAKGRLWAGTMGAEPILGKVIPLMGSLFSLDSGSMKKHVKEITISNGLTWSCDNKKMYYIDSPKRTIDVFDYDIASGLITNRTSIFSFDKMDIPGMPDGMTIDTDGNLWIAVFNGYRVIKIDPRKEDTLLDTIEIPAKQTTSVAFGGDNLDELYVTSGKFTVDGVELPPPAHGATYRITGLGVTGFAGVPLQL